MIELGMIFIVMGVSGSGKTTFAKLLAQRTALDFIDADEVHPKENVLKMSAGIPLTDEDRYPWLKELSMILGGGEEAGLVLACSALKDSYRKILTSKVRGPFELIYLKGSYPTIYKQIRYRENHFFSSDLLLSQFETLEEPTVATVVDLDAGVYFSEEIEKIIKDL